MTLKRELSMQWSGKSGLVVAFTTLLIFTQAGAQETTRQTDAKKISPLSEWSYEEIYESGGLRADKLMSASVHGPDGGEIGSIENVLLDADSRIVALVARVGGAWGMANKYLAIPWDEVELQEGGISTPINADNVGDYGLFDEAYVTQDDLDNVEEIEGDAATGPRTWKLTELLDDYVRKDGSGYGLVTNALFSRQGEMQAVIVEPSVDNTDAQGPQAYPSPSEGFNPRSPTFQLPDTQAIEGLQTFDYKRYASPLFLE
jgi:sporulation protein YlmC with PRC-barrel domain